MPNLNVAGVRTSEQRNQTDEDAGIDQAVVQDTQGNLYNVYASRMPAGKKRLTNRTRAAAAIEISREFAGLSFNIDQIVAFSAANGANDLSRPTVLITRHPDGQSRSLDLLTLNDCASIGTAIATIHRMRPKFIVDSRYPAYTTEQIRMQLVAWIQRLRAAGHVPQEITNNWDRIMETEGLWSFETCPVHGGFSDGDFIFSGSTITTITNWQHMQINDPARDLAWIFSQLDDTHRNAVLAAYGRMLGNRLDDLIMLRANLWVQMEQVGDFIAAIQKGDNEKIMQFKAQVDRLAHQLGVTRHRNESQQQHIERKSQAEPSTVTVNTLLRNEAMINNATGTGAVRQEPASAPSQPVRPAPAPPQPAASAPQPAAPAQPARPAQAAQSAQSAQSAQDMADATASSGFVMHDWTESNHVPTDITGERRRVEPEPASSDSTMDRQPAQSMPMDEFEGMIDLTYSKMVNAVQRNADAPQSSPTEIIHEEARERVQLVEEDVTGSTDVTSATNTQRHADNNTETVAIPLLEREERAMRDARAGLEADATHDRLRGQ